MFRSLVDSAKKLAISGPGAHPAGIDALFPHTDPAVDGDDCSHDCASCSVHLPRGFKIDTKDRLYGFVKGWSTHLIVATGKSDWVRDVGDEKGSVMQAVKHASGPSNGRLMLSASNLPTPSHAADYAEPTRVVLLPAFVEIDHVTPSAVPALLADVVSHAPTNSSKLDDDYEAAPPPPSLPPSLPAPLVARPSPHSVLVLLCSQKTRDARCGQSAPLIRRELERHLRPLGLVRDLDDDRPGGVGIYFISHVGGHKYSANMMVYRRPDPWGLDRVERGKLTAEEVAAIPERVRTAVPAVLRGRPTTKKSGAATNGTEESETPKEPKESNGEETPAAAAAVAAETPANTERNGDAAYDTARAAAAAGAAQCIWLARVAPEDCENIVKYTILQGKVVKPETQLRGGFDRAKGLLSW